MPYFWTDQYDLKIQAHGTFPENAETSLALGTPEEGRFAVLYGSEGRTTGVLGWNVPGRHGSCGPVSASPGTPGSGRAIGPAVIRES
ncbi:oxidoreductase C-terminal domain-containing protein [Streptomyces sp. M19]